MSKEDRQRFHHLQDEINKVKKEQKAQKNRKGFLANKKGQSVGWALRVGIDLVAAILVGFGIGWVLDTLLGTKPWFMIIFFILGSIAGIRNVYRTVQKNDKKK